MVKHLHPIKFAFYSEFLLTSLYGSIVSVIADAGRRYGATGSELGFIVGVYSFAAIFSDYIMGWLSDLFGRVSVLFIADLGFSLSVMSHGFVEHKYYLLFIRIVNGLFGGILPVGFAVVADYAKKGKNDYNRLMSKVVQSLGVGFTIGPLLIITLSYLDLNFSQYCLILGLVYLVLTISWFFLVPEVRKFQKPVNKFEKKEVKSDEDINLVNLDEQPDLDKEIVDQNNDDERKEKKETKQKIKNQKSKKDKSKDNSDDEYEAVDLIKNSDQDSSNSEPNSKSKENQKKGGVPHEGFSFKLLLNKDIFLLLNIHFFYNAVPIAFIVASPLIVKDIFARDPNKFGPLCSAVFGLTMYLSSFKFSKWLPEKFGILKSWNYVAVINCILLFVFIYIKNVWVYLTLIGLVSFFLTLHLTLANSLIIYLAPEGTAGRISGMAQIAGAAAKFLTPIMVLPIYFKSYFWFWSTIVILELIQIIFINLTNVAKSSKEKGNKKDPEKSEN
ncbi:major facilitator superfamily domain-containing protein [Anaeramoeba flamelloides]|uniref:Major facilitator superfamily domain-containing protein n=1 Tax=Anaeramoeba flamelloides TaxID=1746091 RepID=A0ABQ8XZC9_9EUKA|nr:major facilitator superfamily domain-containing protein [Anaeramoeba flamelloides]